MVLSEFKFSNPKLLKLNFQINSEYEIKEDHKTDMSIFVSPNIDKISDHEAIVELNVEIGENSSLFPFLISLVMGARFKLDGEVKGTDFDKLLEVNAPALLLSYARPIVSSISHQAGIKPINLPFINFTNLKREDI